MTPLVHRDACTMFHLLGGFLRVKFLILGSIILQLTGHSRLYSSTFIFLLPLLPIFNYWGYPAISSRAKRQGPYGVNDRQEGICFNN